MKQEQESKSQLTQPVRSKCPKSIKFLMVVFGFSASAHLYYLLRFQNAMGYIILAHYELETLFFVAYPLFAALDYLTLHGLIKRRSWAIIIGVVGTLLSMCLTSYTLILSIPNLELARNAYAKSRAARGFPVREERLDILFSIPVVWVVISLSVAFSVLLIVLLMVNRKCLGYGQPRITEEA